MDQAQAQAGSQNPDGRRAHGAVRHPRPARRQEARSPSGMAQLAAVPHLALPTGTGPLAAGLPAPAPPLEAALPGGAARDAAARAPAQPGPPAERAGAVRNGSLPPAGHVLAVVARPGLESADLGALLSAFSGNGADLAVLCLTRGEGSELNSTCERLEVLRPWELRAAAALLGVSSVSVADYPDGQLGYLPPAGLAEHIGRAARRVGADLLLVIDPAAAADLDTAAVARATAIAARDAGLAVLARTVAGPGERWHADFGAVTAQARARQRRAVAAHRSQHASPRPGMESGAEGPGPAGPGAGGELVRWLVPPRPASLADAARAAHT